MNLIKDGETLYENISKIHGGHFLSYTDEHTSIKQFFDLKSIEIKSSPPKKLSALLEIYL